MIFPFRTLQVSSFDETSNDNLYLGLVLIGVVFVTGMFSYYQVCCFGHLERRAPVIPVSEPVV